MPITEINTKITPALHPGNVEAIEGYGADTSGYVAQALSAFEAAYQGLDAVHKARAAADSNPVLNDSARLLQVADFASKHQDSIAKKFDAAHGMLAKAIDANEGMLSAPLKASAERPGIANEVRQHVKSLSTAERDKFFNERQKSGDLESLQIVLGAPGYLSGLSDDERAVRTRMYHELKSPDVAKRLKVMRSALDMVETRGPLLFKEMEKAVGADMRKVTKLRNATTEAEKAFVMRDGAGSAVR